MRTSMARLRTMTRWICLQRSAGSDSSPVETSGRSVAARPLFAAVASRSGISVLRWGARIGVEDPPNGGVFSPRSRGRLADLSGESYSKFYAAARAATARRKQLSRPRNAAKRQPLHRLGMLVAKNLSPSPPRSGEGRSRSNKGESSEISSVNDRTTATCDRPSPLRGGEGERFFAGPLQVTDIANMLAGDPVEHRHDRDERVELHRPDGPRVSRRRPA